MRDGAGDAAGGVRARRIVGRRVRPGGLIAARRPPGVILRPGGALDFKLVGGLGGDGKIRAGAQRVEKRRFGDGRADGVGDRGV